MVLAGEEKGLVLRDTFLGSRTGYNNVKGRFRFQEAGGMGGNRSFVCVL